MNALKAGMALTTVLFGGWGVVMFTKPRGRSFAEVAARSWLMGAMMVSITLGILGAVLSGTALLCAVTAICITPGCLALKKVSNPVLPRPRRWMEWILCGVIAIECAILFRYAWTTALGWDGLMVWEIKARIAFASGGGLPADFFGDASRAWSHPDYPAMLPLLETWVYLWIGESSQSFARVIFPPFYLAALLLLHVGVAEHAGRRWAGMLTAALLFFVPFLTVYPFNIFTGYADFPLAVYYLAAVILLLRWARGDGDTRLMQVGIYAAALPWVKSEGSLLWLCVMLVAGVELVRRRKIWEALPLATPGVIVIAGWKVILLSLKTVRNPAFTPVTISNIMAHAGRIGTIARALGTELCSTSHWSVLWFALPLAIIMLAARGDGGLSARLVALVVMPLGIYSGIFVLTIIQPFEAHIDSALPRLVADASLVALLAVGMGLPAKARGSVGHG